MNAPTIAALATATPPGRHAQAEILEYLQPRLGRNRFARPVFQHAGIGYRHFVVEESFYAEPRSTQYRNERYLAEAPPLGAAAIRCCLEQADLTPGAVTDFIVVSCTGLDIPGLDLRLAGQLGMRHDLRRTCILGMGCYAAFPALARAREAVLADPARRVLVLAVELCSLHLQLDGSLENVVSTALFADGAAAALVAGNGHSANSPPTGPRLVAHLTHCDYATFDHMAFQLTDQGFRMRLSAYVPDVLAANVEGFVIDLLAGHGLRREAVRFWGIHPGGSRILDYLQERLGLSDAHLAHSRAVLYDYGNMSSPTVLFVLEDIQRRGRPQPGDYGVLLAFGPGLTMEGALVQW